MATSTASTAKCNLRMAQPAQFSYEKAWWNSFSKTSKFFVFPAKKPHVHMLMKLTPDGNIGHGYVLQLLFTEKKIVDGSTTTGARLKMHRFGIIEF
jgi:hypothetical protein